MVSPTKISFRELVETPHPSSATVNVSLINTSSRIHGVKTQDFFGPPIPSHPHKWLAVPILSFLIRHSATNKTLLFDLGIRKDWEKLSPGVVSQIRAENWTISVPQDVATVLTQSGVDVKSIDTIVLSHAHFDHIGNPSTFPKSTSLLVGPGFKKNLLPGYPSNLSSTILDADYANRKITEMDFDFNRDFNRDFNLNRDGDSDESTGKVIQLGRFAALDFFGDGSFYLLSAPGHAVGHLCGLARVTSSGSEDSGGEKRKKNEFVLMAGDAFHHVAELRPSPEVSLPVSLQATYLRNTNRDKNENGQGDRDGDGEERGRTKPFYTPLLSHGNWHLNALQAEQTVTKLQEADAVDEILVIAAHDETVLGVVDEFPREMAGFGKKGWKEMVRWRFLEDFKGDDTTG